MKRLITRHLLMGVLTAASLISCNTNEMEEITTSTPEENKIAAADLKPDGEEYCGFVDGNWPLTAILKEGLRTPEETNFMKSQLAKIVNLWGQPTVPILKFVDDPFNPDPKATRNASSYTDGKIYYGYGQYYDAQSKGGDNIANVYILAHEYGHQLQYKYQFPRYVVPELTARAKELEADAFAGFYLKRPNGYNKSSYQEIAAAYEYAAEIADNNIFSPNHHGTAPQRRSAVRLGFLLGYFDLTSEQFDTYFTFYYGGILLGIWKNANQIDPKIDQFMQKHIDELQRIKNGQMSEEEYHHLK